MPNLNYDILLKNIHMLKKKEGITQTALAESIGMSEPNFNKAYNNTAGKRFNLEQVVAIANHFNISVDDLLGDNVSRTISNREICSYIVKLYEARMISFHKTSIQEKGYLFCAPENPYDDPFSYQETTTEYYSIYFQRFLDPDTSDYSDEDHWHLEALNSLQGNESNDSKIINAFLEKFKKLYDMHMNQLLSDDEYRLLLKNALDSM